MQTIQRGLVTVALTCLFLVPASSRAADAEWPCWRGPNHDGKSPATGLLKQWPEGGPTKLWQVDDIGRGFSTVTISNGLIYTTGDVGGTATETTTGQGRRRRTRTKVVGGRLTLFALGMNGTLKWKTELDDAWTRSHPGSRSTPTLDGDRLYVLSGNGVIACRDAGTGAEVWTKNTRDFGGRPGGWGYAESILILDQLAIVKPGGDNCVVALNKATGDTVWASSGFAGGPEYSSCVPFTHNGRQCITTGTKSGILCLDAGDGSLLWSNAWCKNNTANCPDPAYADGYVFWSNGYGKGGICLKLTANGAEQAWTTKDMVCHHGGYVIHEGHIYGNHSGGWACLDLATGEKKWYEHGVGKGAVCWADGMLFLFGERNGVAGLAACFPDGFEMRGQFSVEGSGPSWAHPVVIDGRLYLRYDSHLYCFDVKAPQ